MKEKQISALKMPFEVLEKVLKMREDHSIIDVFQTENDKMRRSLTIVIEGSTMVKRFPGDPLTFISTTRKDAEK